MGDAVERSESSPSEPELSYDQDAPLLGHTERSYDRDAVLLETLACEPETEADPTHKQYPFRSDVVLDVLIADMLRHPECKVNPASPDAAFLNSLDRRVRILLLLQKEMSDVIVKISRVQRPPPLTTADVYVRRDALLERIAALTVARNRDPTNEQVAMHLKLLEHELADTKRVLSDPQ